MKLADFLGKKFLSNESGAITIDWTVLVAGLVGVGLVITAEVAYDVRKVTTEYDGIDTGEGMMTMFVNNPQYPNASAQDPETDPGPTDETSGTEVADDTTQTCNAANPGNDKCVGNAGETPNGKDGWGTGSHGRSR